MVYRPKGDGSFSKNETESEKKKSTKEMVDVVYRPNGDGSFSKNETEIEKKKSTKEMVETAVTVAGAVVAVAGIVAWGVSTLFSSPGSSEENPEEKERKRMKRPGKDGKMFRDDFESDPKNYFKELRKQKKKTKQESYESSW